VSCLSVAEEILFCFFSINGSRPFGESYFLLQNFLYDSLCCGEYLRKKISDYISKALLHDTVLIFKSVLIKTGRACGAGHVYRALVVKPEGKRSLGRTRRKWEDNIKMDLQEVGGGRGDWMELA
jgi:hypothetical protein